VVSWMHPEKKAVSRLNSDALVTQLPSNSVRPARTLFLKVKVLSVPVSGKHIANMARVSTVRWNLKEACGKPLVRRTEIMYKAYSSDKTAE
jgi:hypothetical protein